MKYHMQFSNNQNPISEIKTDRITLATPGINNAGIILDAVRASSEDIYPWLPWAKKDIALKDIKNYIKHFMDCNTKANPSNLFFDIWDNESDKYLGNIYFGQIEWRAPAFSIGYWIDSRESNKGYMTEAVNALSHVAFRHFKAKRIEISTSNENFSAKRIPEKLNFDLEAEFINHHKNYATNKISNTLVYSCVDEKRLPKLKSLSWKSALPSIYKLKQIETPRLLIRPVQLGDEYPLNIALNNSLELLQKWQPWAKDPSIEATLAFVQRGVFAWESASVVDFPMVVIHKEDNKIIAASGYNDRSDPKNGLYEIGYWCDVGYQGKGYVTEYVNALTKYALEELKAKTVVIRMEVDNSKSIALAERLNFKNQGTKPSVTKDNATDHYFTCENIELLPPLDLSWSYEENNSNDPKIIAWAKNVLNISDDKVFAESKTLLKTPWSRVMAVNTASGSVYLKHMPEKIALEADIIKHLKNKFNASVPEVISDNKDLNCFLMKDAGISLRSILKKKFNVDFMCEAINQFTKLQISIGNNVEGLLELGVPDWRVDKLAVLFANLLEQKDLLVSDGLSEDEISQLTSLLPKITLMCEKLSSFAVHDSLVQCDFHDNNILFDKNTDSFTYIDLGEVVISHPFFSLAGCLWQMHKHYGVKEPDANFQKIQASCFKNFIAINTEENVLGAFKTSKLLWYVYEVLAQYRLIQACDREKIMEFQHGKLSKILRDFIVICKTFNEK